MPKSYRYLHYDVFTDRLFGGNQLAVVLDGRGLSSQTMQAIANEMNFSETTFLLPPEQRGTDFRLRIFTPSAEMPMAGHPTIGSAFALARAGVLEPARKDFVFGLGVGPTPVSLTWRGSDLTFAWMTQRLPTFSEPIANPAGAAGALGLPQAAVAGTGLPVQVVSCGLPFLFIPLATRRAVDNAASNFEAIDTFFRAARVEASGVFLFSHERGGDKATVYSRMFAPEVGVAEDPATGSASGPLGCYLVRHKIVSPAKAGAILNLQGVKMGRPSHVHVSIGVEKGDITSVRVGGEAVLAGEGTLYI
ncbi:MAG TPA: PhzF family phenazine biosynthesis protein [Vicinamibacterales bacterium]|jgi:trans-2,3-dihydro-3-hydroxyanthranilate isomerase